MKLYGTRRFCMFSLQTSEAARENRDNQKGRCRNGKRPFRKEGRKNNEKAKLFAANQRFLAVALYRFLRCNCTA